jgi:hypothetical protein
MSNVFDTSKTTNTTLPAWYQTAQSDAATAAKTALGAATPYGSTVLKNVTDAFGKKDAQGNAIDPYTQATNNLLNIQKGNASPYNADGTVNTSSPLGQLFSAQNAQLNQMLPGITGKEGAVGIGGGNFGSLRGQTATQTARGGALTTLAQEQAKALLDAQNQSIQAGSAVGNIQNQYGTEGVNLSNAQLAGGLPAYSKYEDILGAMGPTLDKKSTETNSQGTYQNVLSALNAVGGLTKAAGLGATDIAKLLSGSSGISWLDNLTKKSPDVSNPASTGQDFGGAVDTGKYDNYTAGGALDNSENP